MAGILARGSQFFSKLRAGATGCATEVGAVLALIFLFGVVPVVVVGGSAFVGAYLLAFGVRMGLGL